MKIISQLPHGYCFTLRQLCGETYWLGLKTPSNRTKAGLAMAELVRTGKLPLKFARKIGNTWMYALDDVTH
jgi:hypothetical protein